MKNQEKLLESIDNKIDENKKVRNIVITSWVFSLSSIVLQKEVGYIMALSLPSALSFGAAISIGVANIMLGNKKEELNKKLNKLRNEPKTASNNKQIKEIENEVDDNTTIKNLVVASQGLSLSKGLLQNSFPTSGVPICLGFLAFATASFAWIKLSNRNKKLEEQYDVILNSDESAEKKLVK